MDMAFGATPGAVARVIVKRCELLEFSGWSRSVIAGDYDDGIFADAIAFEGIDYLLHGPVELNHKLAIDPGFGSALESAVRGDGKVDVGGWVKEEKGFILVFVDKRNGLFGELDGGVFELAPGVFHRLFAVKFKPGF